MNDQLTSSESFYVASSRGRIKTKVVLPNHQESSELGKSRETNFLLSNCRPAPHDNRFCPINVFTE